MDRRVTHGQQTGAALRSPVSWTVLGLVIERPSYGYELLQRYRRTYGETLALTGVKQIYEALDALRVRSLIEEVREEELRGAQHDPAPTRRPKPHYRATEEGVAAYQDWLFLQIEEERQRHRLFARQLAVLEPQAALEVIDEYERECLADADEATPALTEREGVANRLADQDEQLSLEAKLSWIRYAREELADLLDGESEG